MTRGELRFIPKTDCSNEFMVLQRLSALAVRFLIKDQYIAGVSPLTSADGFVSDRRASGLFNRI
jgi:hypothetical protein